MLNSVNMQRKLYPEMYEEKDRMDAKEGKRSLHVACPLCIDVLIVFPPLWLSTTLQLKNKL
jgi:hypothetical protein